MEHVEVTFNTDVALVYHQSSQTWSIVLIVDDEEIKTKVDDATAMGLIKKRCPIFYE